MDTNIGNLVRGQEGPRAGGILVTIPELSPQIRRIEWLKLEHELGSQELRVMTELSSPVNGLQVREETLGGGGLVIRGWLLRNIGRGWCVRIAAPGEGNQK